MIINRAKLLAFATLLLPVSYILRGEAVNQFVSYYDEFYVLIVVMYGVIFKYRRLSKNAHRIFIVIILTYAIGLISNVYSELVSEVKPILIDLFTIYKQFLVFIFLRAIISEKEKVVFIESLISISKIFILLVCALALISQFIDLGMTQGERYGIKAFFFVSGNHSALGISIIACLLVVAASNVSQRKFAIYLLGAFITLLLTTKGVIYSFVIFTIIIYTIVNKGTIKVVHLFVLVGSLLFISSYQITTYFMDEGSARMLFLATSVDIAKDFFPLGSGFATFGGDQARINYSSLYFEYDFNSAYGLGKGEDRGMFLNDNYLAMIIGQTGYVGMVLYGILLYYLFQIMNKDYQLSNRYKILSMAALLMLIVSSIATGIIKSTNGVFLLSMLSILSTVTYKMGGRFNER